MKITSPFGEWFIDLTEFDLECFLESCEYWGVKARDMRLEFTEAMGKFDKAING